MDKGPKGLSISGLITAIVAVVGLLLSTYNTYQLNWKSEVHAVLGKQAKLFVIKSGQNPTQPQPCILAAVEMINEGGGSETVFDSKLAVTWMNGDSPVLSVDFTAFREVDDLAADPQALHQMAVGPVGLHARTSETRNYIYVPQRPLLQQEIPSHRSLMVELYIRLRDDEGTRPWSTMGCYTTTISDSQVWKDLASGPPYRPEIVDLN